MKILTIITIVLTLFFSILFLYGILQKDQNTIQTEINVDVPESVVMNTLSDVNNYQRWCPMIFKSRFDESSTNGELTFRIGGHIFSLPFLYKNLPDQHTVIFMQKGVPTSGALKDFTQSILLTGLPDGTTNIQWQWQYQVKGLLSKVFNALRIRSTFQKALNRSAEALKKYLEHS